MDFSPYQSSEPASTRSPLSPPRSRTQSPILPIHSGNLLWGGNGGGGGIPQGGGSALDAVSQYETSLPIRLDFEAAMAYVLLPPVGGVLLLILEHKSDYVR